MLDSGGGEDRGTGCRGIPGAVNMIPTDISNYTPGYPGCCCEVLKSRAGESSAALWL
jgi:hypothetical protein